MVILHSTILIVFHKNRHPDDFLYEQPLRPVFLPASSLHLTLHHVWHTKVFRPLKPNSLVWILAGFCGCEDKVSGLGGGLERRSWHSSSRRSRRIFSSHQQTRDSAAEQTRNLSEKNILPPSPSFPYLCRHSVTSDLTCRAARHRKNLVNLIVGRKSIGDSYHHHRRTPTRRQDE